MSLLMCALLGVLDNSFIIWIQGHGKACSGRKKANISSKDKSSCSSPKVSLDWVYLLFFHLFSLLFVNWRLRRYRFVLESFFMRRPFAFRVFSTTDWDVLKLWYCCCSQQHIEPSRLVSPLHERSFNIFLGGVRGCPIKILSGIFF